MPADTKQVQATVEEYQLREAAHRDQNQYKGQRDTDSGDEPTGRHHRHGTHTRMVLAGKEAGEKHAEHVATNDCGDLPSGAVEAQEIMHRHRCGGHGQEHDDLRPEAAHKSGLNRWSTEDLSLRDGHFHLLLLLLLLVRKP